MTSKTLQDFFLETRQDTENICKPLEIEDCVVQPIVDVSPPKWHLGHTTWFFEEFILKKYNKEYELFHKDFGFVFNSYYESIGEKVIRTDRGNLSRPTVDQIYAYRKYVTDQLSDFIEKTKDNSIDKVLEIGIHHEKQHQELLLTDIKYILGHNPLLPVYSKDFTEVKTEDHNRQWFKIKSDVYDIGHADDAFCYDNELGQHKVYVDDYKISSKLVTNREYLDFMNDGGYSNVLLWHAEAWEWLNANGVKSPMYWHQVDGDWNRYGLDGFKPLASDEPVTHVSYYEAYAYAQWKGCRLPTEFEWEIAQSYFKWGQVWEWTESAYLPYPKYKKAKGALGEYNGKFMVNQKVLRGHSLATPKKHARPTYRNFFHPQLRWQFNGIRLAK